MTLEEAVRYLGSISYGEGIHLLTTDSVIGWRPHRDTERTRTSLVRISGRTETALRKMGVITVGELLSATAAFPKGCGPKTQEEINRLIEALRIFMPTTEGHRG